MSFIYGVNGISHGGCSVLFYVMQNKYDFVCIIQIIMLILQAQKDKYT